MPRFFIDLEEGACRTIDETGLHLPDAPSACREALRLLPERAGAALADAQMRDYVARVRDAAGRVIFVTRLSTVSGWGD